MKVFDHSRTARSESQAKPPARNVVKSRRAHCNKGGTAREDVDNAGAQMNSFSANRKFSEDGECFPFPCFRYPERVVAARVGRANALNQLASIKPSFIESWEP